MSAEFYLDGLEDVENWIKDTVAAHVATTSEPEGQTVSAFKHLQTSEELSKDAD